MHNIIRLYFSNRQQQARLIERPLLVVKRNLVLKLPNCWHCFIVFLFFIKTRNVYNHSYWGLAASQSSRASRTKDSQIEVLNPVSFLFIYSSLMKFLLVLLFSEMKEISTIFCTYITAIFSHESITHCTVIPSDGYITQEQLLYLTSVLSWSLVRRYIFIARILWFAKIKSKSFINTCCITLKPVASLRAHLRVIAPGQHSSF